MMPFFHQPLSRPAVCVTSFAMNKTPHLEPSWLEVLGDEFEKPYMQELKKFLVEEKKLHPVYPKGSEIFNAFWSTPFDQVKVVLLGQDPYHGEGQAHGLCFSVRRGVKPPPSLMNIFRELYNEYGYPCPNHGDLSSWARQGVLMLNTVLTVRAHQANSHRNHGWEQFTDCAIRALNDHRDGLCFVLWGQPAAQKAKMIDTTRHLVLKAPHPSPLSASHGFFGCGHFLQINQYLTSIGQEPINWQLPP